MDTILGSLSLGFLLRSLFAGVFFVLSYGVARSGFTGLQARLTPDTTLFAFAFFSGVTVYGIHRSLLYPAVEWLYDTGVAKKLRRKAPLISEATLKELKARWDRAAGKDSRNAERAKAICAWADLAHMQYASVICILAGALLAKFDRALKLEASPPLIAAGIILLVSALVSDWRLHAVEDFLPDENEGPTSRQSQRPSPSRLVLPNENRNPGIES